ncbi:MAG: tetratricopeptide repeat protein [Muribaculaceae bacterium]|nr:tetratricopeptide repeat protein [Muribaculaceae bacterium]
MRTIILFIISIICSFIPPAASAADGNNEVRTTKQERNLINEGNKLYGQKRFSEAEVLYRKALAASPLSETAAYNLATTLIRQSGSADPNNGNNPVQEAMTLLQQIAENGKDASLAERSFYNLGNLAFNANQYEQSIEMYKGALRKNPDNDKARENLRLAQKKLQEQKNNQNQQNQNQQQNQDQDKQDQNKNQDKQDQNKDQNQDKQQQKQDEKKQDQQPPQQQSGISDANAEKILKAMENEEAATRKRVEAQRKKGANPSRRQPIKPW